jgi:hypothetical protein
MGNATNYLHPSRRTEPGGVTNLSAVMAAYEYGGEETVRDLLTVLTTAYPLGPAGNKYAANPQVGKSVLLLLASNNGIDLTRLGYAISVIGLPRDVAKASGNQRDGKGATRIAKVIARKYNSGPTFGMPELPDNTRKLVVKPRAKLVALVHDDELDGETFDLYPWQDAGSDYTVSVRDMHVGDIDIVTTREINRDPAERTRFLEGQGAWLKALEQVPDVVKMTRRGKDLYLAVDGAGRIYKKIALDHDPDYLMPMRVHENVGSMQSVHALFAALNQTRKAVLPIELFLGGLAVKSPEETAIAEVMSEFTLPVPDSE